MRDTPTASGLVLVPIGLRGPDTRDFEDGRKEIFTYLVIAHAVLQTSVFVLLVTVNMVLRRDVELYRQLYLDL